jgi:DNA replication and repair protein RecF
VRVSRITVKNFRNYIDAALDLSGGRNILIGENAQGKTNLLEAIELIACGRSDRAGSDRELVRKGETQALIEVSYEAAGYSETASLILTAGERTSRKGRINGVSQPVGKRLSARLITVSFKASDLSLLRGGPKFRRDWLDQLVFKLKSSHFDLTSRYDKVVQQRNRLLKDFAERGRVTSQDIDELKVWDKQIAQYGSQIIKQRVHVLSLVLPLAEDNHTNISGKREKLTASYIFRLPDEEAEVQGYDDEPRPRKVEQTIGVEELNSMSLQELYELLLKLLRNRRAEEVARKQTLSGPHRDDIIFSLNDFAATAYASQGQQRSLVLSLKLAELALVGERLEEPPLLLLDDVLAELDLGRQRMLMELVNNDMQTLITTTDLDGFRPEWLEGAQVVNVHDGRILSDCGKKED